jgi:membrane-associated protein
MENLLADYGLYILFGIIAVQAAGGGGSPGKTALVVAAILAARGRFEIWQVIVVAAAAGIVGGYLGYAIGRVAGRRLVEWPRVRNRLERQLDRVESFFDVHGTKAVFLARFLPGLKVIACPAAGTFRMSLLPFLVWHALASIAFALLFGLTAFWAGEAAIQLVERWGLYALIPPGLLLILAYAIAKRRGGLLKDARPEGARGQLDRQPRGRVLVVEDRVDLDQLQRSE